MSEGGGRKRDLAGGQGIAFLHHVVFGFVEFFSFVPGEESVFSFSCLSLRSLSGLRGGAV